MQKSGPLKTGESALRPPWKKLPIKGCGRAYTGGSSEDSIFL